MCVFKTQGALRSHLSRNHRKGASVHHQSNYTFKCECCDFQEICSERDFFKHLGNHLKIQESVPCPFLGCEFKTNTYSTFNSHKCRKHKHYTLKDFRTVIQPVVISGDDIADESVGDESVASTSFQDDVLREDRVGHCEYETVEHKIASLFLCMQTVLHVSRSAVQRIVEEIRDILTCTKFHAFRSVAEVIEKHNISTEGTLVGEIVDSLFTSTPLVTTTSVKGCLSTDHRRNLYFKQNFPLIEPVEYLYRQGNRNSFVYVPLASVLENLLRRSDFSGALVFRQESSPGVYRSFQDGQYFKLNSACLGEDVEISLALYIDEFEVCNPLGTSRKIHKVVAVYWVILNLPSKFRSGLTSIQLGVLGKSVDVKKFGYDRFLEPLIKDLKHVEQNGVFVEALQRSVGAKLFCVCADNLGAHGLAGFQESFTVDKFCRFCLVSHSQIGTIKPKEFPLRTIEQHNRFVDDIKQNQTLTSVNGVKQECVLSKHLASFHPVTGFPPDILHDFFEGVIPVELSLCLKDLISKRFFTLDKLNHSISSFPYKNTDQVNKPKIITKAALSKVSIGGNGHENWALLRLLPLMVGGCVPENEPSWEILMDLKEIVQIVVSDKFTEETLSYLAFKLSDHHLLLTTTFPNFVLKPKHHFIEHYTHLIRCYGPLVDLWTMRFESKHGLFKRVARNVHNTKNVLMSLATKHQQLMAYHLDGQSVFKSDLYIDKVRAVQVGSLDIAQRSAVLRKFPDVETVSVTRKVQFFGTEYGQGMIITAGQCYGQPQFFKILSILVDADKVSFLSKKLVAWYLEHYRSFQLDDSSYGEVIVLDMNDLNHYYPLTGYCVGGKLWVTLRTHSR